jgi:hypothetical protein
MAGELRQLVADRLGDRLPIGCRSAAELRQLVAGECLGGAGEVPYLALSLALASDSRRFG